MNKLISNLSGGMNAKTSPLIIKDTECELILNYNLDLLGALTKRNGYATYASQVVAGMTCNGLYQFVDTSSTKDTQLAVFNVTGGATSTISYNASGTWTNSKTGLTASKKTRFFTFLDYVFYTNGADVVGSSADPTAPTWGTTNCPGTITPTFGSVFQDRCYVANGGASTASRVWFSTLPMSAKSTLNGAISQKATTITLTDASGFAASGFITIGDDVIEYTAKAGNNLTGCISVDYDQVNGKTVYQWWTGSGTPTIDWDLTNNWFDVNPDDGDEITGLENNGNRLLIFKNRAMYRWTYGQVEPDRLIGVGTSSQESVKTNFDLGITFFANRWGIYAYTGGRPKLISRKIQKYVDAVSDWTNVFGEVDQDHYYLAVGNLTVDGRTFTNSMFVYHISLDAWTIYTTATPVKWMARLMPTSPVENIYFGDNTGRTYLFLTGAIDNATDISGEILTKEYTLSFPEITTLNDIYVFAQQRINAQVKYNLDRKGDFKPTSDLIERFTKFGVDKECKTVRLRITDNSSATSIIEGYNFTHTPKTKTE